VPASGQTGGQATGPNPTDRAKAETKHQLVTDRHSRPLAIGLTGANRPDASVFAALLDAIPPIKQPNGRRRWRPAKMHADNGDDVRHGRQCLQRRGSTGRIARKDVGSATRLGRYRWVVARTLAWLPKFRRVAVRDERRNDLHQAFLDLGCALICLRALQGK
jgi:transposase